MTRKVISRTLNKILEEARSAGFDRVISESDAATLLGLSKDKLRRRFRDRASPPRVRLSLRRIGYRFSRLGLNLAAAGEQPRVQHVRPVQEAGEEVEAVETLAWYRTLQFRCGVDHKSRPFSETDQVEREARWLARAGDRPTGRSDESLSVIDVAASPITFVVTSCVASEFSEDRS